MATTEGIGDKTLAQSYMKLLSTGGNSGLVECNPIITSEGATEYVSALWMGKFGEVQRVTIKSNGATDNFFTIENKGELADNLIILSAHDGTGQARGYLRLRQELRIEGTGAGSPISVNDYTGALLTFSGETASHYVYNHNNDTIFDNGAVIANNAVGKFIFHDKVNVGGTIDLDGDTNSVIADNGTFANISSSSNFELVSTTGNFPLIEAEESLYIQGGDNGVEIGRSGSNITPKIKLSAEDSTNSIVEIDAITTGSGNAYVKIGTENVADVDQWLGAQYVQIGDFDNSNIDNNSAINGAIGELRLKSPKTKLFTGAIWFDVQDYGASSGNGTYPNFHCGAVQSGEGAIGISTLNTADTGSNIFTGESKVADENRDLIVYRNDTTTYEILKYDITTGRLDYFHPKTVEAAPDVSLTVGGTQIYSSNRGGHDEKFNILVNNGTTSAFYLDTSSSTNANNTIQEAAPAALTAVAAAGGSGITVTDVEYDALLADVTALRTTVADLIEELKDFRLWKEAGGTPV